MFLFIFHGSRTSKRKNETLLRPFICPSIRLPKPFISRSRGDTKLKLISMIQVYGPLQHKKINFKANAIKRHENLCIVFAAFYMNY